MELSAKAFLLPLSIAASTIFAQTDFDSPLTEYEYPNLQGDWESTLLTPFEHPLELGIRQSYSEQEVQGLLTKTADRESQRNQAA